jgi:hypothetical protein
MQPARIKLHAKEHTSNPVQRPHCRGQGTKKLRDRGKEALKRFPEGPQKVQKERHHTQVRQLLRP